MKRLLSISTLASLAVGAHAQLVLPWHGDDASSYISSFQVRKTGPTGRANTLYITDATNSSDVLLGNTVGLGRAAYFTITNPANTMMALRGDSNGSGMGVFGLMTGTGKGGSFRIMNPANTNAALHGQTDGSGPALRLQAGTGWGALVENGGVKVTASNALQINGGSTFNGNTNFSGFTSVGPRTTQLTSAEVFGISSNTTIDFAGMYVTTGTGGKPFYGLDNGTYRSYFNLESSGRLTFRHGASDWMTAGQDGATAFKAAAVGNGLAISQSGDGIAFSAAIAKASSTSSVGQFSSTGIGSGVTIQLTNASNGARGLDVLQAGVGPGVFATSAGGNGIWGITSSVSAAGAIGDNTYGEAVVGRVTQTYPNGGSNGIGSVVGRMDGQGGFGVRGFVTKNDSVGVMGQTGISGGLNGYGVRGEGVNSAGAAIGVYGKATGAGHIAAVYAEGKSVATGTKSFLIDSPSDPENKMLYHYSMESDEPLNAYSGNVLTDGEGRAWVNLPAYVQQINKDFRYQLTVIGSFARAIIAKEIRDGQFEIRTDAPKVKVSWRVEGVRNDRFVQKYGAPVEVEKPAFMKGKYLSPELYGKDPSRGAFYLAPATVPLLSDMPAPAKPRQNARPRK